MKKLLLKLFLLAVIVAGLSQVLTRLVLSPFWAHPDASVKSEYRKESNEKYNTLFIGSSRMYHHVVPDLFDSLSGNKTHSFNLGSRSYPIPQSLKMAELVLENPSGLKYVFLEITPVNFSPSKKLVHTPRNYYWYDWNHTAMLVKHTFHVPTLAGKQKYLIAKEHALAFAEKNLFIGGGQEILNMETNGEREHVLSWCGANAGFVSLDDESYSGENEDGAIERVQSFRSDTSVLEKRREKARKFGKSTHVKVYSPYADYIGELYEAFKAKGITLFCVIPPRLENYSGVRQLISRIPAENVIDLSSPDLYPEFYSYEFSYDRGHLNAAGAGLFTRRLFALSLGKSVGAVALKANY
jgi:hypothetical protein